ncbi:MAG: TetR/AcrR family transcriptional regulator [Burkholderiales bacterium]|nr:TetR/AcrR family transcriptional regulator [Burkholderiales bacterium]
MTPPLRTKQPTEARQTGLVQAALQLAAVQCPAEITTRDLAAEVGITQGAVFKHFDSKEAIWLAALDWVHESLMARLRAGAVGHAARGALAALRAVFVAHVDFVREHPGVPRLIFQELQQGRSSLLKDRVEALMDAYRQLVAGLLEQARSERSIAADVDTHAATVLFIGAIQGLVMQSLMAGSLDRIQRQALAVYEIYARGLQRLQ